VSVLYRLNLGCQVGTKLGVAICCAYPEEAKAKTNPKTTNFILHTSIKKFIYY
jgi:hypothetical protein